MASPIRLLAQGKVTLSNGTPQRLSSNPTIVYGRLLSAPAGNAGEVSVGGPGIVAGQGIVVQPGARVPLPDSLLPISLADLYADGTTSDTLAFLGGAR